MYLTKYHPSAIAGFTGLSNMPIRLSWSEKTEAASVGSAPAVRLP